VKSFSPTNVVVIPVRESFGYTRTNPTVNVRPDRVTIVGDLPPSSKPTVLEQKIKAARSSFNIYAEEKERRKAGLPPTSSWLASYSDEDLQSRFDAKEKELMKLIGEEEG